VWALLVALARTFVDTFTCLTLQSLVGYASPAIRVWDIIVNTILHEWQPFIGLLIYNFIHRKVVKHKRIELTMNN